MRARSGARTESRPALSKDRVLRAAVGLADEHGIAALTMRRLAQELEVEAMSLYHHVADKNEVLDGMVDVVLREINDRVSEIAAPSRGADWKSVLRRRILAAREILLRHSWAPGLLESRSTMSPAAMRYFDSLGGLLREAGFPVGLVHHAFHALGSRALGFTQELFGADSAGDVGPEVAELMAQQMADEYPYITEIIVDASHDADSTLGWCDDQVEFEFGLDIILDGLERLRITGDGATTS
jgi:AcrR family transcriptional regulator